jgi:hypothetical protein
MKPVGHTSNDLQYVGKEEFIAKQSMQVVIKLKVPLADSGWL